MHIRIKNKQTPSVGIEPTTTWLKATRSTTELGRLFATSILERVQSIVFIIHLCSIFLS
jgi:hypothetical protein